jgi:lycopene beta-cyclase
MRFFYILPFSPDHALVEYTLFSGELLPQSEYEVALRKYISEILRLKETDYSILEVEKGIIPMTDYPFPRRLGSCIMAIGTKGGRVKPSTGYAFLRIQQDSIEIINSLQIYNHPFHVSASPWRYKVFDTTMLQQMHRHGGKMVSYFTTMFKNNPIDRIFRFLDENASIPDNLSLMATLPPLDFLIATIKPNLLKKI